MEGKRELPSLRITYLMHLGKREKESPSSGGVRRKHAFPTNVISEAKIEQSKYDEGGGGGGEKKRELLGVVFEHDDAMNNKATTQAEDKPFFSQRGRQKRRK